MPRLFNTGSLLKYADRRAALGTSGKRRNQTSEARSSASGSRTAVGQSETGRAECRIERRLHLRTDTHPGPFLSFLSSSLRCIIFFFFHSFHIVPCVFFLLFSLLWCNQRLGDPGLSAAKGCPALVGSRPALDGTPVLRESSAKEFGQDVCEDSNPRAAPVAPLDRELSAKCW